VVVSDRGDIAAGVPRLSLRAGLAALADFTAPPARIAILPAGAPTEIGVARTGQAMRDAMATLRKNKP
jgi:hypothetical protein